MEIIAHRGYWKAYGERNKRIAFERAVEYGFGTETDFRDLNQKLKISHDAAKETCMDAEELFCLYKEKPYPYTLALNVKADGIQGMLRTLLERYGIENYFCFDMSIPDMLIYGGERLNYFVRESEYESINELYDDAAGVWMDGFESDEWITEERIQKHISHGKRVCIVSPELHGRNFIEKWREYRQMDCSKDNRIILCTDYPEKARRYFYENKSSSV